MRLTWLRVSSLLRDGHRNKRQTTSAPPDPPKSSPFRVKILCLVLVVRRRRRSSGVLHHSRGKHDFNDDNNTPLVFFMLWSSWSWEEYAQAGVLSVSGLAARESNVRKGTKCFFVVFFIQKFFGMAIMGRGSQKRDDKRRGMHEMWLFERERFLVWFVFVGMFLSFLFLFRSLFVFWCVVCSLAALRVQKILVLVLVLVLLHY